MTTTAIQSAQYLKRKAIFDWFIIAFVLGGMILMSGILDFVSGMVHIWIAEGAMRQPRVYEPVGKTLALYCQSDPSMFSKDMGPAWVPKELAALGNPKLVLAIDKASIEMGGGFHHFGYRIVRDDKHSSPSTNLWELSVYSEDSRTQVLYSFGLPPQTHLTSEELLGKVMDGFDDLLRRRVDIESAHHGKIQLLLNFDQVSRARQACREMLTAMPNNWWAILVNSLIVNEVETPERGAEQIREWVQGSENYFRYLDLAYFYHFTDRPREAADAIVKSTNFDAHASWGDGGNSEYRGYNAALCAYRTGYYQASLKLCDHLLPLTINGNYAKQALMELKAASEKAVRGQAESVGLAKGMSPFDPFIDFDIDRLLGRKVTRPGE